MSESERERQKERLQVTYLHSILHNSGSVAGGSCPWGLVLGQNIENINMLLVANA